MKLHQDQRRDINAVTAYGDDYLDINGERYRASLVVMPDRLLTDWAPGGFDGLSADDLHRIAELQPTMVIIGTGARQRFPAPAILRPLIDAGLGFEIMDLHAACRTYNILAGEGRVAAGAFLFD